MTSENAIAGCLLGTAVGDALGLPYEGLSKQRLCRFSPNLKGHSFLLGKGMLSDDTEHTCMVAQALIVSGGEEGKFARSLSRQFRLWLLALPAGVGYATLRSILKLCLGFPPHRSGVFSAGNGAAMRSAILGVCYGHHLAKLQVLVTISTRITHTDPKAEYGALAVAIAAYLSATAPQISPSLYHETLQSVLPKNATDCLDLVQLACDSAARGESADSFAHRLGFDRGVSGYVYSTVPIVIQVWLRSPENYQTAMAQIIALGGDTDTTAAILGGIIGARVGKAGIPQQWLDSIWEYPRSVLWIETLGQKLAQGSSAKPLPLPFFAVLLRNLFFLVVVLFHGFRRLFPPY